MRLYILIFAVCECDRISASQICISDTHSGILVFVKHICRNESEFCLLSYVTDGDTNVVMPFMVIVLLSDSE